MPGNGDRFIKTLYTNKQEKLLASGVGVLATSRRVVVSDYVRYPVKLVWLFIVSGESIDESLLYYSTTLAFRLVRLS